MKTENKRIVNDFLESMVIHLEDANKLIEVAMDNEFLTKTCAIELVENAEKRMNMATIYFSNAKKELIKQLSANP